MKRIGFRKWSKQLTAEQALEMNEILAQIPADASLVELAPTPYIGGEVAPVWTILVDGRIFQNFGYC